MRETHLEVMQRLVSSYDTEAGQRLRYHITRARADDAYARKINFSHLFNSGDVMSDLACLLYFDDTAEGHRYWWEVHKAMEAATWRK